MSKVEDKDVLWDFVVGFIRLFITKRIMKKIYLFSLLLFFACNQSDNSFEGDNKIDFIALDKVPVVEGRLNGRTAFFIIDSGASLSVLDENQKDNYEFSSYDGNIEAAGYSGVAVFKEVKNAQITIGGVDFTTDFKSQDMSKIVQLIEQEDKVTVTGIIGSDIMKSNKFIIDYSTNSISLAK